MSIKYKVYNDPLKRAIRSKKPAARAIAEILNDQNMLRCVATHNPELLSNQASAQHYNTDSKLYKTFFRNISRRLDALVQEYQAYDPPYLVKSVVKEARHFGKSSFYWLNDECRNEALGYGAVSEKRVEARIFAFRFIDAYLKHFFPPSLIQELKQDIDESDTVSSKYAGLDKKLKFWPAFVNKEQVQLDKSEQWRAVFAALLNNQVFTANYQSLHSDMIPEKVTLSPQRIEYVNLDVKLLAYVHQTKSYWRFQMDKLEAIKPDSTTRFQKLDWDNFESYYPFEFRAADWAAHYLKRIGFGKDTKVVSMGAGTAKITGQILLPKHLNGGVDVFDCVNYLANFGDALQVLKPNIIRQEFTRRAKAMLQLYTSDKLEISTPILLKSAHHQTSNQHMLEVFNKRYDKLKE
ncbi:WYL domain-containing protein [Paraglaciecola aestuariivivens]